MAKDYIPTTAYTFNSWQLNLVNTVNTNATTWGFTPAEVSDLSTRSGDYRHVYEPFSNKDTRNAQQISAYHFYTGGYQKYLRNLVQQRLVNNPLVPRDMLVGMGLNPHDTPRSVRPDIVLSPIMTMENLGRGKVKVVARQQGSDSRGRNPYSNGVTVYYNLENVGTKNNPVDPEPTPTPEEPKADTFANSRFNSKAQFTIDFGLGSVGKVLRIYAQWTNTSDASKSSPFSTIVSMVVS